MAPKLEWVRRHEPEVFAEVRHILLPKDYITYMLTGDVVTEVSDASGTSLLNMERRAWSDWRRASRSAGGRPRDGEC